MSGVISFPQCAVRGNRRDNEMRAGLQPLRVMDVVKSTLLTLLLRPVVGHKKQPAVSAATCLSYVKIQFMIHLKKAHNE